MLIQFDEAWEHWMNIFSLSLSLINVYGYINLHKIKNKMFIKSKNLKKTRSQRFSSCKYVS